MIWIMTDSQNRLSLFPGRESAAKLKKYSMGKGLKIMDELYAIYNKYYYEKVSSEIIDLFYDNGKPAGTKVNIKIRTQ
jgi:hypothetical protein